jgi:hypothetical protein
MAHVIGKLERCISIRDIVSTIFTIPEVTQLITLKHYQNFKLLSLFSNKLLRTKARHTDTFFYCTRCLETCSGIYGKLLHGVSLSCALFTASWLVCWHMFNWWNFMGYMSAGTYWRKYSYVCGAHRQEVFSCLWGIPTGNAPVFVRHTDMKCSVSVGHAERKCSRVCGAYRQAAFSCLWSVPTEMF